MNIQPCKCGAEIFFIETPKGAKMPMDIKLQMVWPKGVDPLYGDIGVRAYISHWSTCPLRDEFKKKEQTRGG